MDPVFFATPAEFRAWLEAHHAERSELLVGFHKRGTGLPSMTWPESVDEALCFGWIDGVRKRVDEQSYTIRFTPRRARSTWSAVNLRRVPELVESGRMTPAGLTAYEARREDRSRIYSYEQRDGLDPERLRRLQERPDAWAFFSSQAPWYQRTAGYWVVSAKREETRERRFARLVEDSAAGRRLQGA